MQHAWARTVGFWRRYEHHIGVAALLGGFLFDLVIADRPDSISNNILLLSYLLITGTFIILLNLRERRHANRENPAEPLLLLLVLQFCFGGLASNLLVLYGKSGTLAASALFVGILGSLVLANEFLRNRYSLLRFNVAIYYFLLLTYCVIAVPVFVFHSVGTLVFLMSGIISLAIIAVFLGVLYAVVLRGDKLRRLYQVAATVLVIFCVFSGMYFLNIIPPVPLSLKDIGIYHTILKRSGGDYLALYENAKWFEFWRNTSAQYVLTPGQSAFCFSSVFAPTGLNVPIYHRWEEQDTMTGEWQTRSLVSFPISGGRDEGFRGYSLKSALTPGQWRCNVETARGALIGRTAFTVVESPNAPELSTRTL